MMRRQLPLQVQQVTRGVLGGSPRLGQQPNVMDTIAPVFLINLVGPNWTLWRPLTQVTFVRPFLPSYSLKNKVLSLVVVIRVTL